MCQYFSCVVTKDLKAYWSKKTTAHEEILAELELEDKKLSNREFVRIEINPKNTEKMTRDPKDWCLQVDEESTLPEWFIENRKKAEKSCWVAWEESVQIQLCLDKEEKEGTDILMVLYGSSRAVLYGWSSAELYDSSSAKLYDSSSAKLYDSSSAKLYDSSSAKLYDSSSAELYDSSSAKLYGWSSAKLYDSSSAELYGSSSAELKSKTSIAISRYKIFVHTEATVVKTSEVKAGDV